MSAKKVTDPKILDIGHRALYCTSQRLRLQFKFLFVCFILAIAPQGQILGGDIPECTSKLVK